MLRAFPALLAVAGAVALSIGYFAHALQGTGSYAQLPAVRLPVAIGIFITYAAILYLPVVVLRRVMRGSGRTRMWLWLLLLAIAGTLLVWMAPVFPYLAVALLCAAPLTCPEAANPISWAFLALIGPREPPFSAAWVVVAVLVVTAAVPTRPPTPNEA